MTGWRAAFLLLLLLLPGLVWGQTTHDETVIWNFKNGLKIFGVPYGASGASAAGQLFLSTGPAAGVWFTLPTNCPLQLEPTSHLFVCATGVAGGTLGAAGTLQASDGAGGQAAFGGAACPMAGTFATAQSATGLLTCAAPAVPPLTAKPVLTQASSEFPTGVNLGVLMPGVLTITTAAGVATVSTVALPSGALVGTDAVQDLLNKTVVDRVNPASDPATTGGVFTPNPSLYDVESFSTIAAPFTVANFSGPVRAHKWYRLRMRSVLPQTITWGTAFNANARTPLPLATSGSNYDDLFLFEYDPTSGQLEIIFNSQVVAAASGGAGGTATAAGTAGDVQFHDTSTGLAADTGRYTYDFGTHLTSAQGALAGEGPGQISLTDPHGYNATLVAPSLTQDRVVTLPDADGVLCTTATCGGAGSLTITGTPTAGQAAEWTSATALQGVAVTGIGSYVKGTRPTLTVQDSTFTIQDNLDNTKQAQIMAGSITTGTTHTYTLFNADDTFVCLACAQTLTNKTLTSPTIAKIANLTTNGFVKTSGGDGTLGVDTTAYLPDRGITTLSSSTTYLCPRDTSRQCRMSMTGASGTITVSAPSGTPVDGDQIIFRLICTNSQAISHNSIFINSLNVSAPTTCPADITKELMWGALYSGTLAKWQVIATN